MSVPVIPAVPPQKDPDGNMVAAVQMPVIYIMVICTVVICTVLGLVIVLLVRPHDDNTALNAQILGMLAPTIASILAYGKSQQNSAKMDKLHNAVNGHIRELIVQTAAAAEHAAHAASVAQGNAEGLIRGVTTVASQLGGAMSEHIKMDEMKAQSEQGGVQLK